MVRSNIESGYKKPSRKKQPTCSLIELVNDIICPSRLLGVRFIRWLDIMYK